MADSLDLMLEQEVTLQRTTCLGDEMPPGPHLLKHTAGERLREAPRADPKFSQCEVSPSDLRAWTIRVQLDFGFSPSPLMLRKSLRVRPDWGLRAGGEGSRT